MPIEADLRSWGLTSAAWPRNRIICLLRQRYNEILKPSDIQFFGAWPRVSGAFLVQRSTFTPWL
jgi:hypothetical protein